MTAPDSDGDPDDVEQDEGLLDEGPPLEDEDSVRSWAHAFRPKGGGHWLTRTILLRSLGVIYAVGFVIAIRQAAPLVGEHGLLPARLALEQTATDAGGTFNGFLDTPSVFWLGASDAALSACAWLGLVLSLAVVAGVTNALVMLVLWMLYLSFVHVGQVFYGYGWEILLLEAGFLAIFLCPLRGVRPLPLRHPPPALVVWLYRWLTLRVMLGAGLIKLRGDECWQDFSCLRYHYETQPNPNPLSPVLHHMPVWFHTFGVGFNHFVELLVPFALLAPRPFRTVAGLVTVGFQLFLIASGNLSFLNWLTIVVALSAFDDEVWLKVVPRRRRPPIVQRLTELANLAEPWRHRRWVLGALGMVIGVLSINPVLNMMAPTQSMNRSFERLHLVNTYGAFGSVERTRFELVIQGATGEAPTEADWRDYELPCKPGDPMRRPCVITPYHDRLDWQMWFPFNRRYASTWMIHLVYKLLVADRGVLSLFSHDPFGGEPPRWVRIALFRYRFTNAGEEGWWRRERVGTYIRPLMRDDPDLQAALKSAHLLP